MRHARNGARVAAAPVPSVNPGWALLPALLALGLAAASAAYGQTGAGSTAATSPAQQHMSNTVEQINRSLLDKEKDRPRLPGQAPSRSQTLPGGTAAGGPTSGATGPRQGR